MSHMTIDGVVDVVLLKRTFESSGLSDSNLAVIDVPTLRVLINLVDVVAKYQAAGGAHARKDVITSDEWYAAIAKIGEWYEDIE